MTDQILLLEHAQKLYDAMANQAVENTYTGSLIEVYTSTGISRSHYGRLWATLRDANSIVILRKGRRALPAVVRLVRRPTEEDVLHFTKNEDLTDSREDAIVSLQHRVATLEGRLRGLDVVEAIRNLDGRIVRLEGEVHGKKTE